MIIIPAVDIIEGQCVRLRQGDYAQKTVYDKDPAAVVRRFADQGAELIHLVDLDGAKAGEPRNLDAVAKAAAAVEVPVELGGGIRSLDTVRRVLAAGVDRVILGTAVLSNPPWLAEAVEEFGRRIVVGIDARDGRVAVKGWLETSDTDALSLAETMKSVGVKEIIYTDISRDGMLEGPNLEGLARMAQSGLRLVASGGVSSLEDVKAVRGLEPQGVYAAIIGRALYTGDIDLRAAIRAAKGDDA